LLAKPLSRPVAERSHITSDHCFMGREFSVQCVKAENEKIVIPEPLVIVVEVFDCALFISLQLCDGLPEHGFGFRNL
jgi:hypothetical protein